MNTSSYLWLVSGLALVALAFSLGYLLGTKQQDIAPVPTGPTVEFPIDVSYACDGDKAIIAVYEESSVSLKLSDGRELKLPQTISASGIRYANEDESFVFWSKGNDAFIEEGGETTYANCSEAPIPV